MEAISFADGVNQNPGQMIAQSQYTWQAAMQEPHMACYSQMGSPLYGQYRQFDNRQNMELAVKAEESTLKIETVKETERIRTEADCERKARSLDLQVKHENRRSEIIRGSDSSPVLRSEMLREKDWLKPVADISQCSAVLYTSDIYKPSDTVRRIMEARFHNNQTHEDTSIFHDITMPDEKKFYKCLVANRIKLLCGRRKQLEYAGKLLEWFEEIATKVILPRERGFIFIMKNNTMKFDYISEEDITWGVMMKLCM